MTDTIDREAVLAEEARLRDEQANIDGRGRELGERAVKLEGQIAEAKAAYRAEAQSAARAGRKPAKLEEHERVAEKAEAELEKLKAERASLSGTSNAAAIRRLRSDNVSVYAGLAEESTQRALAAVEKAAYAYTEAEAAWRSANAEWGALVSDYNHNRAIGDKLGSPMPHDWKPASVIFDVPTPRSPSLVPAPEEEAA